MSLKNTSYFNPTLVGGCSLWLDGADPAGNGVVPANGATVSTWADKSGNGLTVSAASSQPTYSTNAVNRLGTVSFNGSQSLTAGSVTGEKLIGNSGNCAIFVVMRVNNSPGRSMPFSWDDGTYTARLLVQYDENSILYVDKGAFPDNRTTATISLSTILYYVFSYSQNGANTSLNINGTSVATLTNFSNNSITSSTRIFNVGSYVNGSDWNMKGNTAEIIFFNTHIPNNFQQIEGYLVWKWGLASRLPSNHPYASSPSYGLPSLVPNATFKLAGTNINHPVVAINGCALWFDGTDPLGTGTAPANGTSLTTWVNKGITPVTLAHGTSQPTYSANFQNGLGSVSFNNNYFSAAYSFNLQTKSAFIVCSQSNNATDSPQGILSFYGSGLDTVNSTNGYGYQASQGGAGSFGWLYNIFQGGSAGYYIATGTAGANTPMGIYGNVFSNQFEQTFKDGSSVTNFTISTTPGMATNLMVGARLIGGGLRGSFFGNICEIIVYNISLSTAQRQTVEGYLAQKWGLTGNLPAGHPFKSSFPLFPSPVTGVRAAANRRWSPLNPGNCQLWLDGSDFSAFTLSSSSVTQWRDKSGNGNHMANNGTSPIYNASLINSLGGIDCTNGGSLISSGFQNSANLSFAMVAVVKSGLGFWGSFFTHGGRDNDFAVERNSIVGTTIHFQTANDNSQCGIAYTVDAPVLYFGTMTSGTSRFFESFSGGTNTTTTGTNSSTIFLGSQLARVGKSDANEVCNSFIGEIIYYTAVLGTTQRQQVEGYLAWKWGLKASLPSSHPYKLFPPSP